MKAIYLDNAATSFPKAPGVPEKMARFLLDTGANINRGAYGSSFEAAETVYATREKLSKLFNFPQPENIIFTKNVTESLNLLIKGLFRPGDHVIISSLEHNAVIRTLTALAEKKIEFSRVPCDANGQLDPAAFSRLIRPDTRGVVMTHASNVSGAILPLEAIGRLCQEHGLFFVIDSAQTAGFLELDFTALGASAIAFTGHKGLLGPQGIGGLVISQDLASRTAPLIEGGTGSRSDSEEQPEFLPDKFEAGTLNLPGIYGLSAALDYLFLTGIRAIREMELELTGVFLEKVFALPGVKVIGPLDLETRIAIVSLDFPGRDNADIANRLAKQFGIMTRCGLHCAPGAHQALGTFPRGTVRFSFSHFNTRQDIDLTVDALAAVLSQP